jgi:hypothetical protein
VHTVLEAETLVHPMDRQGTALAVAVGLEARLDMHSVLQVLPWHSVVHIRLHIAAEHRKVEPVAVACAAEASAVDIHMLPAVEVVVAVATAEHMIADSTADQD